MFFVTFLVIAYLRSGDFATIGLVCAGCFGAGMVMLTIKPHVAARFASWGHIWEDVYDKGFQQTHTLTAAASGGMIGVGGARAGSRISPPRIPISCSACCVRNGGWSSLC